MAKSNKTSDPTDTPTGTALPAALEALCQRFGINPDPDAGELAGSRILDATREAPETVIAVTAGGVKLTAYGAEADRFDEGTEVRLRQIFRCFRVDPKTKETIATPLPTDLTLPAPLRTGQATSTAHRYEGGYLRREAAAPGDGAPATA